MACLPPAPAAAPGAISSSSSAATGTIGSSSPAAGLLSAAHLTLALARTSLPVRQRISASVAAVLIRRRFIGVRSASAMLWIVLPIVVAAGNLVVDVRLVVIVYVLVVHVDVDIVVAPAAIVTPASPVTAPGCAYGNCH